MEGDAPEREIDFDFDVSEEAGAAVYANIVSIWYSPYEFASTGGSQRPPRPRTQMIQRLRCGSPCRLSRASAFPPASYLTYYVPSTKL